MEEFPDHRVESDDIYVMDGKRITCAGGQSAVDVAIRLIERHCGRSMTLKVMSAMLVEAARGPGHPQPHPQARWFREINSTLVQRAILLMEQQSPASRVVEDIAAGLGVSVRTLVRSFQSSLKLSPAAFLRALRMAHGRWDVLNTDKAIGWIASDCGFSDAAHFTRLFRQYYGITPAAARDMRRREPSIQDRKLPHTQRRRRRKTALDHILWGDPLSFAAIDWPSETKGRGLATTSNRFSAEFPDR